MSARRVATAAVAFLASMVLIVPVNPPQAVAATPGFVQVRAKEITSGTINSLAFSGATTAGNTIVVAVLWSNTGGVSLSDNRGNAYTAATTATTWGSSWSQQVFFAKNIVGGSTTVTATFASAINSFGAIYIHEYSGLDKVNPLDVTKTATGAARSMSSGAVTTTNANDLLFSVAGSSANVNQGGSGYTTRSTAFGNRTQDRNVTTTGSYTAAAAQNGTAWVIQLVAFRADAGTGDTTPPTVSISAPAAGATVAGTVSVTASASDDVAVAGVQFVLDGANLGAEDTSSPYAVSWDTTTASNGSHALTARARDAAGNTTMSAAVAVTVSNVIPPPGVPAASYAFDEGAGTTTVDASGHGLTGTLTNGAAWAAGKNGTAVILDGVNDFVSLGNPSGLQLTGSMTISAWINSAAFPVDDAAIVSKRGSNGYQLDTTIDTGPRVIGFKLTSSSGADMIRYGATAMQPNGWYHVAGVYNATARTLDVYLNGQLDDGVTVGTVTTAQQNSSQNVLIGQRPGGGNFDFNGQIDDARIYSRALTAAEIQADMATPVGSAGPSDPTPPTVAITAPANSAQVNDIVTVTADAADDAGVAGVQFYVDGTATGVEDLTAPYALQWDTRTATNGAHTLTARARDTSGNTTLSAPVTVNVNNTSTFQNEVLATGFSLPTSIEFLPDGRMLVVELAGRIKVLPPPYTQVDSGNFLQLSNVGSAGVQQGVYDIALDPNFATNHFYYLFYTAGSPNRDRLSRFTANATNTGTVSGSEVILYQDPEDAHAEHHGGAINIGNDGKLYFTTGEHFNPSEAQQLTNPRGKIHRINLDGTAPTDNPFYDGAGPNVDSIWAYGLRNPYRASYDAPTGRLFVGDVGGNDYATAFEEVDLGQRGANYAWPNCENNCPAPYTNAIYSYPHNGRDASITGGFVYRGSQFPAGYVGSYFFADYTQNWIRRLTFDTNGNVNGLFNFEPTDGSVDGPYGDIVYLTQGPDGALYYVDLGYSDISGTFGVSKVRRIRFVSGNQPPVAVASANPTSGPAPLAVTFSSAGSSDPEGQTLSYAWTFGDGGTSTAANPSHTYTQAGSYTARLTVSDGTNSALSPTITITAGAKPTAAILSPQDGALFKAGDVISFSGDANDPEDGTLPASAFNWNIDFLHEGHVHPGSPIVGVKSGTFTIPTTGHDFSGNTRYRITLTVTDSDRLTDTKVVTVWPTKVNLSFDTAPTGLTLFLDGIAKPTPFVYDTLVGFNHTIEARNQTAGSNTYTFASWSDGGAQQHTIVAPQTAQSYVATYNVSAPPATPAFVQVRSTTPQTAQTTVALAYSGTQTAGNTNIVAIGWSDVTSTIASMTDGAGNVYQVAAPIARGGGLSQAIYYAKNIKAAVAGANTVTVQFSAAAPFPDLRITEYSGLDPLKPFDVAGSGSGSTSTATSANVTTTSPSELLFGAGMTSGIFTGSSAGYTTRIITPIDADIVNDRNVTSVGTYNAGGTQNGTWVMQIATFRAAGQ
jgi:glucose/arabinose dehydrogenase